MKRKKLTPKQRVLKKWPECESRKVRGGWLIFDPLGGHFGRQVSDIYPLATDAWNDAARRL
jgi:hypothetical protein